MITLLRKALAEQGVCHVPAKGSSMKPLIYPGNLLEIRPPTSDLLFPGQIVLYENAGELIAHRIKYCVPGGYLAAGDTNILLDAPIRFEQIIGVVATVTNGDQTRKSVLIASPHNSGQENSHPHQQLSLFLPPVFYQAAENLWNTEKPVNIFPLEAYNPEWIAHSYGVSPQGIMTAAEFKQAIQTTRILNLVCYANFGPENHTDYFPVNQVKAIFRPGYTSCIPALNPEAELVGLLTYLCGLFQFF